MPSNEKSSSSKKGKGKGKEPATGRSSRTSSTASSSRTTTAPASSAAAAAKQPKTKDAGVQASTVDYVNVETNPDVVPHVRPTTGGYVANKNAFYQQDTAPGSRSIATQTADTYYDPKAKQGSSFHTEKYIDKQGTKRWENEDRVYEWPGYKYEADDDSE